MTRILPRQCCLVPNVVYVICGQCLYMCPQILLKISHFFYYGNAWNGKKYWFANQNYLTWIFLVIWQCLFLRFDNWHLTFTFAISRFALVEKSHFWTLAKISVFLSGTKSNLTEKTQIFWQRIGKNLFAFVHKPWKNRSGSFSFLIYYAVLANFFSSNKTVPFNTLLCKIMWAWHAAQPYYQDINVVPSFLLCVSVHKLRGLKLTVGWNDYCVRISNIVRVQPK